jgi:hypothetical protein
MRSPILAAGNETLINEGLTFRLREFPLRKSEFLSLKNSGCLSAASFRILDKKSDF